MASLAIEKVKFQGYKMMAPSLPEITIANRFKVQKRLGKGAFGVLYQGLDTRTNEEVAIKLESVLKPNAMLMYEAKLYNKLQGYNGIANIHWVGKQDECNAMVMDILGPNLQVLFEFCGNKFSAPTFNWIAF